MQCDKCEGLGWLRGSKEKCDKCLGYGIVCSDEMEPKQRKTLNLMGMELPVIAELPLFFYLVAHPNGPAIATEHSICTIWYAAMEGELPREVAEAAIKAYEKATWRLLKAEMGLT